MMPLMKLVPNNKVVREGVHFTFISVEPYLHYTGESHSVTIIL